MISLSNNSKGSDYTVSQAEPVTNSDCTENVQCQKRQRKGESNRKSIDSFRPGGQRQTCIETIAS